MCAYITEKFNKTTTNLKLKSFAITTTERWRGGATGKAFGLAISRLRVQMQLEATLRNNLRQVVHTSHLCASVSKQYNLVPAKGR